MKLADVLTELHTQALNDPGQTVKRRLQNGLNLAVRIDPGSRCTLSIGRLDVMPSPAEWRTVCNALPYAAPAEVLSPIQRTQFLRGEDRRWMYCSYLLPESYHA